MKRYKFLAMVLALALIVSFLPACGPSAAPATEEPAKEEPVAEEAVEEEPVAEEPAAAEPAAEEASSEVKKFGLVLHITGIPFTQQIADGAIEAAEEFGYEVEVVGPPAFEPATAISMFEALVQKDLDGIAVVAYPAETWVQPINRAQEAGIPVLTLNVHSAESDAAAWFGQDEYGSGKVLAQELLKYLEGQEGDIILGVCAPGVNVLLDRLGGFRDVMADHPEFNLLGEFDVTGEPGTNYTAWQNLLSANPDAVAMVGFCAPDLPNLSKLKEKTGAEFVAAGYDLEPDALSGIKEGYGVVTVGQNPYLQGYLPMLAFSRYFEDGTPLPEGWVDVGTEVVDASNVDDVMARENDPELTSDWYHAIIAEQYSDMNSITKPFPGTE